MSDEDHRQGHRPHGGDEGGDGLHLPDGFVRDGSAQPGPPGGDADGYGQDWNAEYGGAYEADYGPEYGNGYAHDQQGWTPEYPQDASQGYGESFSPEYGSWQQTAPGSDYDGDSTTFLQLPPDDAAGTAPLEAPGHGYTPPMILPLKPLTPEAGTDPGAAGGWSAPRPPAADGTPGAPVSWPDAGAAADPHGTGQWTFPDEPGPAPGAAEMTGQWSVPIADGDLPEESGEYPRTARQGTATPPSTLPGGAPASWTTLPGGATAPWAPAPPPPPADDAGSGAPDGAEGFGSGGGTGAEGYDSGRGTGAAADEFGPGAVDGAPDGAFPVADGGHTPAAGVPAADFGPGPAAPPAAAPGTDDTTAPAAPHTQGPGAVGATPPAPAESAPETAPEAAGATAGEAGHQAAGAPGGEQGRPEAPQPGAAPATALPAPGAPAAVPGTDPGAPDAGPGHTAARHEPDTAHGEDPDAARGGERDAPEPVSEPVSEPVPGPSADEHPATSYVLRVNGTDRPVADAWIGESLLYVLRERLGLAGAKDGCSQGECGACNVQVDGRLVASCLVPAATAAGSEVRTVEGLAADGEPSDVQRALAACGAVQCGFCIPGMAMTVHDLLEGNHAPTELETRQALCGNLCRCSGYQGVLAAVRDVVAGRAPAGAADTAPDGGQDAPAQDEARIPHQAPPGAGSVQAHPHDGGMA